MGVIITTTNNISCYSIKEYRGAVCANQVLGANVFADFLASWTDFLGGKSGAYRDVLDELFADVRKQMIDKATFEEVQPSFCATGVGFSLFASHSFLKLS